MKILVISDSHNNIANLKHVLGFGQKIKVGVVIHCGDWNTVETVETVLSFGIPLYAVVGNADIADNIKTKFPESLEIEIDGRKIGITHSIKKVKFDINNFDIIFCGHRHKQEMKDNIVNPGALENGINFAIYDTVSGQTEFITE